MAQGGNERPAAERRLTRQGRERKAQLLQHAARLFAERGYHQTRVIDIVRSTGVAKGLFYWYFENKEALFRELIEEMRHQLRVEQGVALDGVGSPLARIYAGTAASVRFMAEHRELYALMQIEGQTGTRFQDVLRDTTAVHARDTAVIVEAGQRQGIIRTDDDALSLSYGVLAAVLHLVYFHRTGRMDASVEELSAMAARFVTRAVASTEELALEAEREVTRGGMVLAGT